MKCIRVIKSQNSVYSIAVSPDDQTIVSGHGDSTIKLSNLHTGELIHTFYVTPMADCCVAISSDGLNIAGGDGRLNKGCTVKLWDLKNRQLLFTFNDHSKKISAVAFCPNTKLLASSSGDGTIKIWDYSFNWKNIFTGRLRNTISNSEWVESVAFSPDGQILASSDDDQNIKLWNWRTGELLHIFRSQGAMIDSLCFSANGKILINSSGYGKGKTEVWSLTDKKLIYTIPSYSLSVAISPDGQTLALGTGNEDKTIVIYNLNKQQLIDELEGHSSGINCLTFTSDGSTLISGGRDSEIRIWKSLIKASMQPNPKPQIENFKTSRMDYTKLLNLLASGEWRQADEETTRVIQIVGEAEEDGYFNINNILNFPREDLCIINQLWLKYSNGRFGFSVQKRIYQSLGGKRNYDEKIWEAFGDSIGWKKEGRWLNYDDMIFSLKAPEGHLPGSDIWMFNVGSLGRFLLREYL